MSRPAKASIDLNAIGHNYRLAKQLANGQKAIAIIKADAYGHGAVAVAEYLENSQELVLDAFGVACIEEAIELRDAGIRAPILLLEGFFSPDELTYIAQNNLWTAVHDQSQIDQIANAQLEQPLNIWLKMDTGMHRLGFSPDQFADAYHQLLELPHVETITCMSHFACADDVSAHENAAQLQVFNETLESLTPRPAAVSIANSAATLSNEQARANWQRPGIMLYGASPFNHAHENGDQLLAAMSLTSAVIALHDIEPGERVGYSGTWEALKPSRIATVAIGYADGYPRHLPSGSPVWINGQEAKLAGRVSMDMITVDVTGLSHIALGSPVELWGKNISANRIAQLAGTISYTLFTGVTKRVPRKYSR